MFEYKNSNEIDKCLKTISYLKITYPDIVKEEQQ